VVRAPDDYGATYLADSSLLDLFERASADTPPWFRQQVDRLSTPSLPPFDPTAALAGVAADSTAAGGHRRRRSSADGQTRSESEADRRQNHPLSDVWGDG
jgi:hypothetical protein